MWQVKVFTQRNPLPNVAKHSTREEAEAWLERGKKEHWFGKPAVYESRINEETGEEEQVLVTPAEEFTWEIKDITAELEQQRSNEEALRFLNETDWLCLRHQNEKELGLATSLTSEEYLELLRERQQAREIIIK